MKENNKNVYEAPELVELDKVENVTLGHPNLPLNDNCCCTKRMFGGFIA
jgi:hypothetical protein